MRKLVLKRLKDDWALLLILFVALAAATSIPALAPVYLNSLEQLAFNTSLEELSGQAIEIDVFGAPVVLDQDSLVEVEHRLAGAINANIRDAYLGQEAYFKSASELVDLPTRPLPEEPGTGEIVSRGFFQHLTNLGDHANFLEGRMAGHIAGADAGGPQVEAVIAVATADRFHLGVGDTVTLTPDLHTPTRITARIVGILEPNDPGSDYWRFGRVLLEPPPLEEVPPQGIRLADPAEAEPPVALFVTRGAMIDVVGQTYPGTVVNPIWFILMDADRVKEWSLSEASGRLRSLDSEITASMPGSSVSTGAILTLVDTIRRRSFFSRVPLMLLLALMVVTLYFYLSMMVTYVIRSRERDAALLRTRGVGVAQLTRVSLLEGLTMTVVAVALAPFLAIGAVALAGKLPYFRGTIDGGTLPAAFGPVPFLVAIGAGLAALALFVLPGALSVRTGVLVQRLQSSRPALTPFFQRYYLDLGLLVLGGLTVWELRSRGHLVSGGLFKDVEVNEVLLLMPVMFLILVALAFMRLFPPLVRFVSGESQGVLHLVTAATVVSLPALIIYRETPDSGLSGPALPVGLVLALGAAYLAGGRARRAPVRTGWLVAQAGLVVAFVLLRPPDPEEITFTPTLVLIAIVPAQIAFVLFKASIRIAPVWASMALWHMARNPGQYTGLVLLLVLVTGLAILSTTVGGTLERSQRDRVLYDIASDIRIADLNSSRPGGLRALEEEIRGLSGVTSVATAFRFNGSIGATRFQVLGLEPGEFAAMSWYRDDFSSRPLVSVMGELASIERLEPPAIPEGATMLGAWARAEQIFFNLSIWMVLEDDTGHLTSISLGRLQGLDWQLMTGTIPDYIRRPLTLVAVQVSEPGRGNQNTPGRIRIDNIHARTSASDGERVIEDFEDQMAWIPIISSELSSESVIATYGDAYEGDWAADFSFGSESQKGIRGFYHTPTSGPMPVVISISLQEAAGMEVGSMMVAVIGGQRVPAIVSGTTDYFPTMDPGGGGFMLADLDSLMGHLNVLGSAYSFSPNEFFISKEPDAGLAVHENISHLVRFSGRVQDRAARLESVRDDPLTTAGWNAMVVLALAVVLATAAFGYAAYLLLFAQRSRGEIGFLESMGLSRRQLAGLLAFEHLSIIVVGLGLGAWAGFRMSRLMVTPLAVTEDGAEVVPPFILVTDWSLMAPTFAALIVVFLLALLVLIRAVGRLDLQAIARLGEA